MLEFTKRIKKSCLAKIVRQIKFKKELKKHKRTKEKYGYEVIQIVDRIGNKLHIDIWIEWGTLLGYAREGGLIGHDYDIDFATNRMSDDQYRRFHSFLKLKGFNLTRQFRLKGDIISETYEYKGTLVDIDYCDTDDNGVQYLEYDIGENTQIVKKSGRYYYKYMDVMIYHAVPFEIKRGIFANGTLCNVPDNFEEHIEFFYGRNWRIPIPDFDWKSLDNYESSPSNKDIIGWRNV